MPTRTLSVLKLALGLLAACSIHDATAQSPRIKADIVYGHKDGLALTFDSYEPMNDANGAAVIFMVSGGWFSRWTPPEQVVPLFKPYLDEGYHVFAVRHGSSPRYSIPEAVSDVRRAVRFIRHHAKDYHVDPERLGVFGMSAGGHLTLMLGTSSDDGDEDSKDPIERVSNRVAAVAALVPPTDLSVAVWSAPESLPAYRGFPALDLEMESAKEHSPVNHVSPGDAPALVIMGEKDELVPPKHGTWIAAQFQNHGVTHKLIVLPNSGHGLDINQPNSKAISEVVAWFKQHLK